MKLNLDCVRDVLQFLITNLKLVPVPNSPRLDFSPIQIRDLYAAMPQYLKDDIYYSICNLKQAGYIEARFHGREETPTNILIDNVSFTGHQFYDSIQEPTTWEKTKNIACAVGNHTLRFLEETAQKVAAAAAAAYVARPDVSFGGPRT